MQPARHDAARADADAEPAWKLPGVIGARGLPGCGFLHAAGFNGGHVTREGLCRTRDSRCSFGEGRSLR